jgi:dCMP deaminase
MDTRSSWDEYFVEITNIVATRSTCLRRKVGAIAVKDRRIVATGYNGSPSKTSHCADVGCIRQQMNIPSGTRHELCRAIHAEQNLIIQAAIHSQTLEGCDVYCTTQPCIICAKMLIGCKVKNIYYHEGYNDPLSEEMFKEAGINFIQL